MALATVGSDGSPSARMVLCRGLDPEIGWLAFYTDGESEKGRSLATRPRAALVFYWEPFERQVRVEGPVTPAPVADSDAYWRSRPRESQLAAATSLQSAALGSREELVAAYEETARRHEGRDVPRPARWGGYRVWGERVELWVGQPGRLHDRARWVRALTPDGEGFAAGPWSATRLQP